MRSTRPTATLGSLGIALALALLGFAVPVARAQCFSSGAPDIAPGSSFHPPVLATTASVSYCGGPIMHTQRTHLILWQPAGTEVSFDPAYESQLETFLGRVAAVSHSTANVFGLMGQYGDGGGLAAYSSTYGGAIIDTDRLPTDSAAACSEPSAPPLGTGPPGWTACVSDAGIQAEVEHVIATQHLRTGLKDVYFVVTPDGLGSCFGAGPTDCALGGEANQGYCGYHSATGNPEIVYAVIPYNAISGHCQSTNPRPNDSPADPTISTIAHEFAESATDPLGDAWSDSDGNEIADLCITSYGRPLGGSGASRYDEGIDGGHYWIQELWSNHSHACEAAAKPDRVSFPGPRRPRTDRPVEFTAHASDPDGNVPYYNWSFGDGRSGRGRHAKHKFRASGTYTVTLRITDSWGNWAYAKRRITVAVARTGRSQGRR